MNHTSGQLRLGCALVRLRERINPPLRQTILQEGVST
jgi:hypothetical protein